MKRVRIVQVGVGLIGSAVSEQIADNQQRWSSEGLDVGVCAILSRTSALVSDKAGFPAEMLREIVTRRRSGSNLAQIGNALNVTVLPADQFDIHRVGGGALIVLDAAVGAATSALDVSALAAGGRVLYSNKAPLSQPLAEEDAAALWAGAVKGAVLYETTCGAGLPVISTIKSLLATGDSIIEIVGCLSGTLGAIFADIAEGRSLSAAIRAARDAGYTEPDPRDDLSGLDVARKALILARTIGRNVDLHEISVESLVPLSLAECSVEDFLQRIAEFDAPLASRQEEAAAEGKTLKYLARVPAEGPIVVGVEAVPRSTVLGALQGPENIISIRTARYDRYPLTISGPGAGAAVTAAGMISDMLELARAV
jgi:homoserine dehydrogenase/aspartokinase/homoserine dehydrogenase 1